MPGNLEATRASVLLVDDEAEVRGVLGKVLRAAGHPCVTASSAREALEHLAGSDFAVVVSDIVMPGMGGMELLAEIRARYQGTDTILMTGSGTTELAVEAMKMGARDFLMKPFPPGQLVEKVSRLLAGRVGPDPDGRFEVGDGGEIIGRSPSARRICEMVQRLRGNMANVLICGDTGCGKELVARAIHYGSDRSGGPFIAVNCAGVPRSLAESHFFGHVRGAYTGAASDAKGFFRAADGGTLFLDEVTEVSLDFQAVLLRVIQEREVVPVGSTVPESVDIRVIAATSRHCRRAVHGGLLREDLYYRLAVACVCVPPLRDRREDIPLLVDHFLALYAEQFSCAPKRVSRRAMDCLKTHDWPGNVRELSNVIERAYALLPGPTIGAGDLANGGAIDPVPHPGPHMEAPLLEHTWPGNVREQQNGAQRTVLLRLAHQSHEDSPPFHDMAFGGGLGGGLGGMGCAWPGAFGPSLPARRSGPPAAAGKLCGADDAAGRQGFGGGPAEGTITLRLSECSLDEAQRAVIERALEETGGNKNKAAKMLGINRATLYRKLARFGWRNVHHGGPLQAGKARSLPAGGGTRRTEKIL